MFLNNLLHRTCRHKEAQLQQEVADLKQQLTTCLGDLNQAHAVFEYTVFDLEKRLSDRESELQECKKKLESLPVKKSHSKK